MAIIEAGDLADIDVLSNRVYAEGVPHELLAQLRERRPIHFQHVPDERLLPEAWVMTRYDDVVTVEKGRHQPEEYWECPRVWARVALEHSPIAWYPRRLTVAFQGQQVEIGQCLNEEERGVLAEELQQMIGDVHWHRAM